MSRFPRYLSFAIGFLSLSQEILWVRLISFIHETLPQAFSFVLMFYLFGIALGAEIGKRICSRVKNLYQVVFWVLFVGGVLDALLPLSVVAVQRWEAAESVDRATLLFSTFYQAFAVTFTSFLKSIIFPIAHHLGTTERDGQVGSSVSKVYFFNIVGSALGPIITGFYLLNALDLQSCFLLIAMITLVVGGACGMKANLRWSLTLPMAGVPIVSALLMLSFLPEILVSKIVAKTTLALKVKHVIQNRHGIIHTYEGGAKGDVVYGGNTYDGGVNTNLVVNSNGIHRAYVLATFHPRPKRVLMIGLSSGSWAKVISGIEGVEHMDVIEINPGYLDLIGRHPEVSSVLKDSRVNVHIDDGRRWLKIHPNNQYDLIVMNTTWHWKLFVSNLLSKEFLLLLKKHLKPGGVVSFNSTGSKDALKTSGDVFEYAYLYANFVVASDTNITARMELLHDRVYAIHLDGQPALKREQGLDQRAILDMAKIPLLTLQETQAQMNRPLEIITEQNMLTEFKYGRDF